MMRRVLLTGASGFIGFHAVKRLRERGCDLCCLVRESSNVELLKSFDVRFHYGNLADPGSLSRALDGCDTVLHLAGRVRARNLNEFLTDNRDGTRNLARAAAERETPPTFVYVSSLAAAGPSDAAAPKRESDLSEPVSHYGRSKLDGEKALVEFAAQMPVSIVRPGIVFGEADRMNLELFKTVRNLGICPIPGWRDRFYSWIHAADLVELLILVAQSGERLSDSDDPGSGVYFGTMDDGIRLSEAGRTIGRSLGRRRTRALPCPPVAVWSVSTFYELLKRLTGKHMPYDWAKALESMNHWRCTPEKAARQLGFSPGASFEERIDQTARWYREHRWL